MMTPLRSVCGAVLAVLLACAASAAPAQAQKKDYLTQTEADKIRGADQPAKRITLFLDFAEDRLKKFEYERARPSADRRRSERLNSLLNDYTGCLDDAAELIDLGRERQWDIREGIKRMLAKGKEFLATLQELSKGGADLPSYKTTLEDAVIATEDALAEAEKADKEYAPPPIRRRP